MTERFSAVKANFAEVSRKATPLFANFGLTENGIVAAGFLIASGNPGVAIIATLAAADYITRSGALDNIATSSKKHQ